MILNNPNFVFSLKGSLTQIDFSIYSLRNFILNLNFNLLNISIISNILIILRKQFLNWFFNDIYLNCWRFKDFEYFREIAFDRIF